MTFKGFTSTDFDVFKIDGLEPRMEQIKTVIRPKLEALGEIFTEILTELTNEEMFAHPAKHARRTVNPPDDTWIAFSTNRRGYKMQPHFQIGLWETHLFVWFAIIYECKEKSVYANYLKENVQDVLKRIPEDFVWSKDHTKPDTISHLSLDGLNELSNRLAQTKKAELLCGIKIDRDTIARMNPETLIQEINNTFNHVVPLYLRK